MLTGVAILVYVGTIIGSNILVAHFGPNITPILAFVFIGLDLSLRDWLQIRIRPWQMGGLIGVSGILTYAFNTAAQEIAVASAISFAAAALADWITFSKLKGSWIWRSVGSNVVGAAVDSVIFPTIAFGILMPGIVIAQFMAKTCGGAIWVIPVGENKKYWHKETICTTLIPPKLIGFIFPCPGSAPDDAYAVLTPFQT